MVEVAVRGLDPLLPPADTAYLEEKAYDYEMSAVGAEVHLVLRNFDLGAHYAPPRANLLIIIPAGYPNAHPDMFWTQPDVRLASGQVPLRADVHQDFPSGSWQRWSRHFRGGWRPGVDTVRTYVAAIRSELARGL